MTEIRIVPRSTYGPRDTYYVDEVYGEDKEYRGDNCWWAFKTLDHAKSVAGPHDRIVVISDEVER